MISGGFTVAGAIVGAIFLLLGLLAWYITCKYLISPGFGCIYDPTNTIFVSGLVVVIIIFAMVHLFNTLHFQAVNECIELNKAANATVCLV
jgi:hypothetical protein